MTGYFNKKVICAAVVCLSVFTLYFFVGVIKQKPTADDWMMLEIGRQLHGKGFIEWITVKDDFNQWRPLPYMVKGLYLNGLKKDIALYNAFKLGVFVCILFMIYFTSRAVFEDKAVSIISVVIFLLNPTNIGALQNIDHIYKLTGTLFFGLSVLSFYFYVLKGDIKYFAVFVILYSFGFLSDADNVAVFPAVIIISALNYKRDPVRAVLSFTVSALILLIYLNIRGGIVGGAFSGGLSGRQDIVFSLNILYNIAKMLASTLMFSASPYIYLKKVLFIAIGGFFLIMNLGLILLACMKSDHRKALLVLSGLSIAAMLPFILIRHVSEIYTIRPAYLLMIVLAYSIVFLFRLATKRYKVVILAYLSLMLVSGAYSLKIKQDMMIEGGVMAGDMARSMLRELPVPPPFSTITLLIEDSGPQGAYSDFIKNDFQLAGIKKFFVRYNFCDATLNTMAVSRASYSLRWDSAKKSFTRLSMETDAVSKRY